LAWQTRYSDDVIKDKIEESLNDELSKDWSKIDKPDNLSEQLMRFREIGHRNERYVAQHGVKNGLKGNKKEGKKSEGGK